MSEESRATELVVVQTARSPMEAQVMAAVLRGAGIPAYVGGTLVADEFAASQRLMNLGAVRVQVPASRLAEAREALAEARQAGAELAAELPAEEERFEPSPPRLPAPLPAWRAFVWPAVALIGIGLVVYQPGDEEAPGPYDVERTADGWRYRWRSTELIAFETVDGDGDGFAEITHDHNRQGVRVATAYDRDDDGMPERLEQYDREGRLSSVSLDADGDGIFERTDDRHAEGTRTWLDTDGDARIDRVEERDAGGNVVRAWRIDASGFTPTR